MSSTLQFTEYKGTGGANAVINTGSAPGAVFFRWSLNKNTLPTTDVLLHVKFAGLLRNPNNGVHMYVIVGGGTLDLSGVATLDTEFTAAGLFQSPTLSINISSLFAGGLEMEFVKLVIYKDTDGGASPVIDQVTVELVFPPF